MIGTPSSLRRSCSGNIWSTYRRAWRHREDRGGRGVPRTARPGRPFLQGTYGKNKDHVRSARPRLRVHDLRNVLLHECRHGARRPCVRSVIAGDRTPQKYRRTNPGPRTALQYDAYRQKPQWTRPAERRFLYRRSAPERTSDTGQAAPGRRRLRRALGQEAPEILHQRESICLETIACLIPDSPRRRRGR